MAPRLSSRQQTFAITDHRTAGTLVVGVVVFVVLLLCLLLYLLRVERYNANKKPSAAPFRVRGVVRPMTADTSTLSSSVPFFSRDRITASIVFPKKSVTRKPRSYGSSSKRTPSPVPSTPSVRRPLPNTLLASPRPRVMSNLNPAHPHHSRSSSGFSGYTQYRFPPGLSSRLSFASFGSTSQARPVYQPFEPNLPDELALGCGEHLSVLRSFDDGWCVVARDAARASLLSTTTNNGADVDIGLVPIWVFTKTSKGVACTRPFRSTSLNALHLGQNPAYARDWITSWANFA